MRIGIYAGSFDPVTKGHIDMIKRSIKLVDKLIIGVLYNPHKEGLFTIQERIHLIKAALVENGLEKYDIQVESSSGLLVDYAKEKEATVNIRGVRSVRDYEYEYEMALVNKKLYEELETVILIADGEYAQISSSLVKEIASFRGDASRFVPDCVVSELYNKYK